MTNPADDPAVDTSGLKEFSHTMANGVVLSKRSPARYICNLETASVDIILPIIGAPVSSGGISFTPSKICVMGTGGTGTDPKHVEYLIKCLQSAVDMAHALDTEAGVFVE